MFLSAPINLNASLSKAAILCRKMNLVSKSDFVNCGAPLTPDEFALREPPWIERLGNGRGRKGA